jgi:hypothetical protein
MALLEKGRLPFTLLVHYLKNTSSKYSKAQHAGHSQLLSQNSTSSFDHGILSSKQIKECLFVLIQHNIVVFNEANEGSRVTVYYQVLKWNILVRDRFPLFMNVAKEKHGVMVKEVFVI